MNNPNTLTWQAFKDQLATNPGSNLQFELEEGKWVDPSYHITEIKQAAITSVDCGGLKNTWTEVIIQLWEPGIKQQEKAMKASKALSIIHLVEKTLSLPSDAEVKIEFGNSRFDTRQMYPIRIAAKGENLLVSLSPDTVQCKAINRGDSCGTTKGEEGCCARELTEVKPQIHLQNLAAADSCSPGSGCCC